MVKSKTKLALLAILFFFNFASISSGNISSKFINNITSKATNILSSEKTKEIKIEQLIKIGEYDERNVISGGTLLRNN